MDKNVIAKLWTKENENADVRTLQLKDLTTLVFLSEEFMEEFPEEVQE